MSFIRSLPSIALLAAAVAVLAVAMLAAGCSRRIVRARSVRPATNIVPLGGASATNVSVGDLAELPIFPLPSGDVLLLTRPEPDTLLLQRISVDSMKCVWRDSIPSVAWDGRGERGLQLFADTARIALLTTLRFGDSLFTIARTFDAGTGEPLVDSVISGAEPSPDVPAAERRFRSSFSPERRYAVTWVTSDRPGPTLLTIDLQLLNSELAPLAARQIRLEHDVDETLESVEVTDSGTVYVISQNRQNSIRITRIDLLHDEKSRRLAATFANATARKTRLLRPVIDLRNPEAPRVVAGAVTVQGAAGELDGIASATLDFRSDSVTALRYAPISRDTILRVLGTSFIDPFPVTCLTEGAGPVSVMIFEERSLYEGRADLPRLGNVLMTAIDAEGALTWTGGFRKEQYDVHPDLPRASFEAHRTVEGTIRFSYVTEDTLRLREYRVADGTPRDSLDDRPVLTVRRDARRTGYLLRPTLIWVNDHTALAQVATVDGDEEDVRLCRIRY
jgi:hypothetical protein